MYRNRIIEKTIINISKQFPVILVTGPRQVGKTTLLQHLSKETKLSFRYVSLDDFSARNLAEKDPELFFQQYTPPIIIDEIQYAPQLLRVIKVLVDRQRKNGMFWLTGSQHFHLMQNVSESLAGRVAIVKLLGFSSAEVKQIEFSKEAFLPRLKKKIALSFNLNQVFERIVHGSFPRLYQRPIPSIEMFYSSYLQTYIERDLRNIVQVRNISTFEKFLRLLAARVGQLVNYSSLAQDLQVSVPTVKEWVSVLEAGFQIYLLRPYYQNIGKRDIKTSKIYFLDTGLLCYLIGWKNAEVAMNGAMNGNLFENFVITEIIKSYWFRGLEAPIWFWRNKEKQEIDIIIEQNGKLYPIEIKLASRIPDNMYKEIQSFNQHNKNIEKSAVLSLTETCSYLTKNILSLPLGSIE